MNNGDVFRVCTCNCVDCRQLTNTEGSDERRDTLYTGVAISGVASVELIAVADPLQTILRNVVEGNKVVVAGNTMD